MRQQRAYTAGLREQAGGGSRPSWRRAAARPPRNGEIAHALHVTMATAKTHVGRLLAKLGARDRAQLVMVAYETGLVQPG